jgi:hypothetical protein
MKLEVADIDALRPLLHDAIARIVIELHENPLHKSDRLGYTEGEAAAMIGVARHVLRDCRLRGEIAARRVGKRFVYARTTLLRFLEGTRRE